MKKLPEAVADQLDLRACTIMLLGLCFGYIVGILVMEGLSSAFYRQRCLAAYKEGYNDAPKEVVVQVGEQRTERVPER